MIRFDVNRHLAHFGPGQTRAVTRRFARLYTLSLTLRCSATDKTMWLTPFLPPSSWQDLANVYAFGKWTDDLADSIRDAGESARLLVWWRAQLLAAVRERSAHPVLLALSETMVTRRLDTKPFTDFIEGVERDRTERCYETFEDLVSYCRLASSPFAQIVLAIFGYREEQMVEAGNQVAVALQLFDIALDVREDYRENKMLFFPRDLLARYKLSHESLVEAMEAGGADVSAPVKSRLLAAKSDYLRRAEAYLALGDMLVSRLRRPARVHAAAFVEGGRLLLRRLRSDDYYLVNEPPKTTVADKLWTLRRAISHSRQVSKGQS